MQQFIEDIENMTEAQLIHTFDHLDNELFNPSQENNFLAIELMKDAVQKQLIVKFQNNYTRRLS